MKWHIELRSKGFWFHRTNADGKPHGESWFRLRKDGWTLKRALEFADYLNSRENS